MLKRVARFISFFTLSLLIGCGDPSIRIAKPSQPIKKTSPIAELLKQAQQTSSPASERLLLNAVRLLREEGKIIEASNILTTIDSSGLPTSQQADIIIETAYQALYNQDPDLAVSILTTDRINFTNIINQLDAKQAIESSLLRAAAWEASGNFLLAARERIYIAPLLQDDLEQTINLPIEGNISDQPTRPPQNTIGLIKSKQQNTQQIWLDLTSMSVEDLQHLSQTATFDETQGWFQLAWLFLANQDNLDAQASELDLWVRQHGTHPAANPLPESLAVLSQLVRQRPSRIALLLPLKGPYLPASRAIQDGFLAAHFTDSAIEVTKGVTEGDSEDNEKLTIRVYDSSDTSTFLATYQQAITEGAELVIGALQKVNVKTLQHYEGGLPVPTIALNRGENYQTNPANLYQFGLSPADEAHQVAAHAMAYEYKNAAVLYPDSAWGERVFKAFNEQWSKFEGTAITSATFDSKRDYSSAIKQMLMIQQSKSRASNLKRTLGVTFEFLPRRRQDIDFVFILASPKQARQIKPLLDFHYAADIPVYATSHVYEGQPTSSQDRDINGIEFCDIPWVLVPPTETQKNLVDAWPNTPSRYRRLNALGVDAYRLHARIQLLTAVPNSRFFGATGILSLSPENHITRELNWAQIRRGIPVAIPKHEVEPIENNTQGSDNATKWNQQQWRIKQPPPQPQDADRQPSGAAG